MQDNNRSLTEERTVDLRRVLRVLLKRAWIIVAVAVLAGVFTFIYSSTMITPTYRSSFSAYVNNRVSVTEDKTTSSDLNASMGLMYVYEEIVLSRAVLLDAASRCDSRNFGNVTELVSCYVSEKAPIIYVYVETEDPALSKQLAENIALVAPEHVSEKVEGSSMSIIDAPRMPVRPYSPNVWRNTVYALVLGILLTAALVVILDLVYDIVQDSKELEDRYGLPVVGAIPDMLNADKSSDAYGYGKGGKVRQ